jgi:hypothetical protein
MNERENIVLEVVEGICIRELDGQSQPLRVIWIVLEAVLKAIDAGLLLCCPAPQHVTKEVPALDRRDNLMETIFLFNHIGEQASCLLENLE